MLMPFLCILYRRILYKASFIPHIYLDISLLCTDLLLYIPFYCHKIIIELKNISMRFYSRSFFYIRFYRPDIVIHSMKKDVIIMKLISDFFLLAWRYNIFFSFIYSNCIFFHAFLLLTGFYRGLSNYVFLLKRLENMNIN